MNLLVIYVVLNLVSEFAFKSTYFKTLNATSVTDVNPCFNWTASILL